MKKQTLLKSLSTLLESKQGIEQFKILILKLASNGLLLDEIDEVDYLDLARQIKSKNPDLKADVRVFRNSKHQALSSMRIADIVEVVPQSFSKIKSSAIKEKGRYPVVDQGKAFVSGFSDVVEAIEASQNPVIVFGDHTRNIKYVDFDFVVGADGVKILRPYSLNPKYFFYMAQALVIESRGYGRHFRELCSSYIPIMSIKDQLRTVKIVEEIFAVCGMLEVGICKRTALLDSARKSIVDAVSTAQTPEELHIAWQRAQKNWEVVAGTVESINEIRGLILTLATSGLLVKQDLSEPKPRFASVTDAKQIPENWIWSELEAISQYGGNGSVVPDSIPKESWILDLEDIEKKTSKLLTRSFTGDRKSSSNKTPFQAGDVLYGKLRPYLDKVLVADMSGFCTTEIVPIKPKDGLDPNWLRICLKRPEFVKKVTELSYGTKMPRLGTSDAKKSVHPIPPLEEQRRIVERVDQLMQICDQLDKELILANDLAERFSRSVVSASV